MLTLESDEPYWEALVEIDGAARYFEYYGNQAETVEGRSIALCGDYLDFTIYEPFSVSTQIIPWNYPLEMTARGISPLLATANTCVVKTPELDPISNIWLARAADAVGLWAEMPLNSRNERLGPRMARRVEIDTAVPAHGISHRPPLPAAGPTDRPRSS